MSTYAQSDEEAAHRREFAHYCRTGEQLTTAQYKAKYERKFNPNHDPDNGQFTFGAGGSGGGSAVGNRETKPLPVGRVVRSTIRGTTTYPASPTTGQNQGQGSNSPPTGHPGITNSVVAAARKAQRDYGVPASITIAQYALESGWGHHMPPGSNNPFGIKARPGEPFVETNTWEQDRHGRKFVVKARFRKFDSLDEAFTAHAQLLRRPAYARAQAARSSADYADALTGVYATDHQYGNKLKTIIRHHGLEGYDGR